MDRGVVGSGGTLANTAASGDLSGAGGRGGKTAVEGEGRVGEVCGGREDGGEAT